MAKDDQPNSDSSPAHDSKGAATTTTKVSRAEEEALIESFSKPLHELEDALEQQRQNEREVFKQLIEENAQLKKANEKAEEKLQAAHTKYELLRIDLEAEQKKCKAKDGTINGMENDMRTLIMAKKSGGKGKGKKSNPDMDEGNEVSAKYSDDMPPSAKHAQQIKDLKFRLKRLAEDESAKDERIHALETELVDIKELLIELQKHVDEAKLGELKQEIEERKQEQGVRYYDKQNVVSSLDNIPRSAFCVIQ